MDDADDYDDAPLLTRQPSYRIIKQGSNKSFHYDAMKGPVTKIKNSVPYMAANLFATVLEDVLTQFRILDECNNQLRIYKTKSDYSQLQSGKYGISSTEIGDELSEVDPKNLESEHHKLNKLAADRNYCKEILTSTYLALALKHNYSPLVNSTQTILDRRDHFFFLIDEEVKNKVTRRELVRRLRQQRVRSKSIVYETNIIVDNLRSRVEDASLMKKARSRYVEKWQNSRTEQHFWDIQETELKPTESITLYRRKLEEEHRAHSEVELYSNIVINEVLKKVEDWMSKYDEDIDTIDLKIQIQKINAQTQKETRHEMEELLAVHAEEMKKWLQFKVDREKANLYRIKMTNAAIVVQAWWRGLLVRMELGPFKSKKRRAPKSNKNK